MATWRENLAVEQAVKHSRKILPFHEERRELQKIIAAYEKENLQMRRHISALEASARNLLVNLECGGDASKDIERLWALLPEYSPVDEEVRKECESELK